jgi:hypothetical protein
MKGELPVKSGKEPAKLGANKKKIAVSLLADGIPPLTTLDATRDCNQASSLKLLHIHVFNL